MPGRPISVALEPEQQKTLGVDLFNLVWTLLEKSGRAGESRSRGMADLAFLYHGGLCRTSAASRATLPPGDLATLT